MSQRTHGRELMSRSLSCLAVELHLVAPRSCWQSSSIRFPSQSHALPPAARSPRVASSPDWHLRCATMDLDSHFQSFVLRARTCISQIAASRNVYRLLYTFALRRSLPERVETLVFLSSGRLSLNGTINLVPIASLHAKN